MNLQPVVYKTTALPLSYASNELPIQLYNKFQQKGDGVNRPPSRGDAQRNKLRGLTDGHDRILKFRLSRAIELAYSENPIAFL